MLDALACIGTAVALFSVVKRQHEGFARGFVTTRMFEAAVIVIGVVSIMGGRDIAADRGLPGSRGPGAGAVRDATFLLGPGLMPAFNAALLGYLMYRSGLVPLLIPAMGLIGAPLLTSSALGMRLGVNERGSVWEVVGTAPIFFSELSLRLWMTFKGFNPSAPILAAPSAEWGSPATS